MPFQFLYNKNIISTFALLRGGRKQREMLYLNEKIFLCIRFQLISLIKFIPFDTEVYLESCEAFFFNYFF